MIDGASSMGGEENVKNNNVVIRSVIKDMSFIQLFIETLN